MTLRCRSAPFQGPSGLPCKFRHLAISSLRVSRMQKTDSWIRWAQSEIVSISQHPSPDTDLGSPFSTKGITDAKVVSTPQLPWVGAVQALFSFNSRTQGHVQVEPGCAGCGHARSCALSDTVPYHGAFKAVIFGSQIFFINKWGQKLIKSIHLKQRTVPGAAFQRISCGTAGPFEMLTTTERLVFPSKANGNTRRTKQILSGGQSVSGSPCELWGPN